MKNPLRIVHLAGSAQWAGGEVFLKQMAEGLDRSRFDMRVICPEEGPLQGEMKKRGVPSAVVRLDPLGNPRPIFALRRLLKEWGADILQSHGARSNFYARLAAGGIPNISTLHNALGDYPVPFWKKALYQAMDRFSAIKATRIVCVAEALRREVCGRIPSISPKTLVIHNGVEMDRFTAFLANRAAIRASLGLADEWTLGIIGRMTDQKGHVFLLEALREGKNTLPSLTLLIVGDGPNRSMLEQRADRWGLRSLCRFLGVRNDVPEILTALDVLVMPSLSEGFPYVLLEGLCAGKPVVASSVNGVAEIMPTGQEGFLVPSRDPGRLLKALQEVAAHPDEAARRASLGRDFVRREFSAARFLDTWSRLYVDVAGGVLANTKL